MVHRSKASRKKFSLRRTRYNKRPKSSTRRSRHRVRKNYGAGLFSNAFQNFSPGNSFRPNENNSQPFQPHSILSTASRLATPFFKSMNNPNAFQHPIANTAFQVFNQARPLFNKFQQDPQGALNSVMNHPATGQLMSLVGQHLPFVQQAVQTAYNQPITNTYGNRNGNYSPIQTNQYNNPWKQPPSRGQEINMYAPQSNPNNSMPWNSQQFPQRTQYNQPNYQQGYRGGGKSAKRRRTVKSRRRSKRGRRTTHR